MFLRQHSLMQNAHDLDTALDATQVDHVAFAAPAQELWTLRDRTGVL